MRKISWKVQEKRLLTVAKWLREKVTPERFVYDRWIGFDWEGRSDLSCGTVACVLGHATQIPAFRRAGLKLLPRDSRSCRLAFEYIQYAPKNGAPSTMPWTVVEAFFGADTMELFQSPASTNDPDDLSVRTYTPKMVARRIEQWVARKRKLREAKCSART